MLIHRKFEYYDFNMSVWHVTILHVYQLTFGRSPPVSLYPLISLPVIFQSLSITSDLSNVNKEKISGSNKEDER